MSAGSDDAAPVRPFFDAFYYGNCCGRPYARDAEWQAHFGHVADRLVADFAPRRALDAGCAIGLLVEALRERHVDAWGVDVSDYAIGQVHESVRAFCRVGSITTPFEGTFDLITCIEVVEHMPSQAADLAIANLCAHGREILFSSSPEDYREPTHVNVHPPEHWAEAFARHGFFRDVDYDASYISPWAMRLRPTSSPLHRVVREYERRAWLQHKAEREARAYATEVQARLAHAETEVADVRAALAREVGHLRDLLAASEARRLDLEPLQVRIATLETRIAETAGALSRAEAEVAALRAQQRNLRHQIMLLSSSVIARLRQWPRRLLGR